MKKSRIVAIALTGVVTSGVFAGCGPKELNKVEIDETKTQIQVATFKGAVGDEWLYALKDRFEEEYKDVPFEEGKTGIQVHIACDKKYAGGNLLLSIDSEPADIFFTEEANYNDFVLGKNGTPLLRDITDIVTTNIPGEEKSIEDKMNPTAANYFKTTDNKYYGIPFWESYDGISYDIELFESKGYFLKGDANNSYKAIKSGETYEFCGEGSFANGTTTFSLSYGPDGEHGTYDDGLPATYEEFYALLDYMVAHETIPFVWTGGFPGYFSMFLTGMWADHEGSEGVLNSITLDNETEELVDLSGETPRFYTQENINTENGYLMAKQEGKYYALKFADKLLSDSEYYYSLSTNESFTHTNAQEEFVYSVPSPSKKEIGMLIEGTFWYNEANDAFTTVAKKYGAEYGKQRRIGFMPFPKATEEDLGKASFLAIKNTICMVNPNTKVPNDALKAFLQFAHSDYSLSEFTSLTNLPRGFEYEIDESHALTPFATSVYNLHANANIIYPYSNTDIFKKNFNSVFHMETGLWRSKIAGTTYQHPVSAMKAGSEKSAEEYFNGLSTYLTETWSSVK